MPELTIVGLRVLREVVAHGSFTGAAAALGYTQSAVSRQVALAEAAVGVALFERQARGVVPTAGGRTLARHAELVLNQLERAQAELDATAAQVTGRLTLGAFPTALATLVPRALARLAGEHPALEVRLREGGSIAQLRRLRAGQLDVAVVAVGGGLDYDLGDLAADRVLLGRLRVAVPAGHRFAGRGWVTASELAGERWIVGHGDRSGPQFGAWPSLDAEPIIAYAVRDWPARLGLVAAGLGIAVVPSVLDEALPPGVASVTVDDPRAVVRETLAVTGPRRSREAQALVDALAAVGAELVPPPGPT